MMGTRDQGSSWATTSRGSAVELDGGCEVLVADDDASIAEVVADTIALMGHRVRIATDGRHALELVRAIRPALVVTDLMMPMLDGAGLIVALRAEAAAAGQPPPPVILMTAAAAIPAGAGADAVLRKPFDLLALEELVTRLLGGYNGAIQ